jgi:AcrR family transcriptional regulator
VARRPPDRRQHIADAASSLFRERGFHNVSMADIADAVGITAPALYKHFRNKQQLLCFVVVAGTDTLGKQFSAATDLESLLRSLASYAFERRGLATLWQREARHLHAEQREELRRRLVGIAQRGAVLIAAARPVEPADAELLSWAVLGALASLSWHRITLPRRRFEDLIYRLTASAAYCELGHPAVEPVPAPPPADCAATAGLDMPRREQLLTEAIRLFDERGFGSVSTDEIGEAAGVSGPGIYKHFPSKTDLLVAAIARGGERRQARTASALARATGPRETLILLLQAYTDFALENSHLLGVLISELGNVPEQRRKQSIQVQRDFLALWEGLLEQAAPAPDPAELKITVRSVLAVIDNVARTRRLAARPDAADRLVEIGAAMLLGGGPQERVA